MKPAGERVTYTWNIENMCSGIALPNSTLNTFAYDADLVRRQAEDSDGLVKFINAQQNVLAETDSGGTTQVAYTLDPQLYGNLISQRRSGATSWHQFDGLGSTERLTDSSESDIATYLHKAFGLTSVLSGSSNNRYTWIGRLGYRWEPDALQYDVRLRRLDVARGKWLSTDPLQILPNWYVYAKSSPVGVNDPSGLVGSCDPPSCGADITRLLKNTAQNIRNWFHEQFFFIKRGLCEVIVHPFTAYGSWDIIDLAKLGESGCDFSRPNCRPIGYCEMTATIGSSCHTCASANYVAYGIMTQLCYDSVKYLPTLPPIFLAPANFTELAMILRIRTFKIVTPGAVEPRIRWAIAGYRGWPAYATPPPDRPLCEVCPDHERSSISPVLWWPYVFSDVGTEFNI